MACTANKAPLLRSVASRGFSTQANPKAASRQSSEIQTTTLPNKLVVATAESNLPLSRVSVLFRAGSRNETYDNLGTTHVLRIAAALSNKRSTSFGLVRNLQEVGANLSVTTDREVVAYSVDLCRNHLDTGLKFLQDASVHHSFKPWEVTDRTPLIKYELGQVSPQVRSVDLLHKAAFHGELGNSVFCAKHHVGRLSCETLQHYVNNNFTTSRGAIVGVGVDHQLLVGFAKNLYLETGSATSAPSKYHGGGELRVDKAGEWAHVALGTHGAALSNQKEALAFAVLQQIAGTGISTKRGNINGALGKVVAAAVGNNSVSFNALNASYTDNGLFGFVLSANGRDIGKAIDAALKALKGGSVSSTDLARGKEQLKAAVLHDLETSSGLVTDIGQQAVLTGTVQSAAEIIAAIDSLTSADVNAAAKKVASGKWSVGAVGNLANVPHVNQLN